MFAVLLTGCFAPALFGDKVFTNTAVQAGYVYPWAPTATPLPFTQAADQADLSMPAMAVQERAYDEGGLPFVDLYSYGGGTPLYADFSTGQAYPVRMAAVALFEPVDAHLAYTLLHLFGAGWFTYLLVRRLRGRWFTGVLAGTVWMFSSWNTAWMHLAPFTTLAALLPATVWALHRLATTRTWASVLAAALALGASTVGGHSLMGIVGAAIAAVYGISLCAVEWWRTRATLSRRGTVWRWSLVPATGVVALVLWAFALVPMFVAQQESARSPMTWAELQRDGFLATWRDLGSVFWPFEAPLRLLPMNATAFVGFLTAALALVGLCTRRPGTGLGRWLALGLPLVMLGGPITWLFFHLPLMNVLRPYGRLAFFLTFGVVLLAAAGLEQLLTLAARWRATDRPAWLVPSIAASLLLLATLDVGHLIHYGRLSNPDFAPDTPASVFPDTPFVTSLRATAASSANGWPGRAIALSAAETAGEPGGPPMLFAAHSAWIGVETASGYNSSMPERSQRGLRVLAGELVGEVLRRDLPYAWVPNIPWGAVRYDLLARNGFDLIVTPPTLGRDSEWGRQHVASGELTPVYEGPDGNVYRIVGAAAGAHGVSSVELVTDDREALQRFSDDAFDGEGTVLLFPDDASRLGVDGGSNATIAVATVSDAGRSANGYRFTVTADNGTVVVVPVNWDDSWVATIDGIEVEPVRGNYRQLVLPVPSGTSQVELQFRAAGFDTGLTISAVGWLAMLAVPAGQLTIRRARRRSLARTAP